MPDPGGARHHEIADGGRQLGTQRRAGQTYMTFRRSQAGVPTERFQVRIGRLLQPLDVRLHWCERLTSTLPEVEHGTGDNRGAGNDEQWSPWMLRDRLQ